MKRLRLSTIPKEHLQDRDFVAYIESERRGNYGC